MDGQIGCGRSDETGHSLIVRVFVRRFVVGFRGKQAEFSGRLHTHRLFDVTSYVSFLWGSNTQERDVTAGP